jgi:hypothetical protein
VEFSKIAKSKEKQVLLRDFGTLFRTAQADGGRILIESERPHGSGQLGPRMFRASNRNIFPFFLFVLLLSGCGGVALKTGNTVMASPSTIAFGNVTVGQTGSASVTLQNRGIATVQVEDLGASNGAFAVADGPSFPLSLPVGASVTVTVQFSPTSSGSQTEPLMITSSLSADPASAANMTGTGTPGVSALICGSNAISGAAADNCSVTLNAIALAGGFPVSLATNNAAIALPSSVMVPANSTTASFTAMASTVSAAQTAVLTASGSGTSQSFAISLGPGGGTKKVQLTWTAPESSDDPITGYNVYRSTNGSTFQRLNSSVDAETAYADNTVQSGAVYNYYVESVDGSGTASAPSNSTTVTVP